MKYFMIVILLVFMFSCEKEYNEMPQRMVLMCSPYGGYKIKCVDNDNPTWNGYIGVTVYKDKKAAIIDAILFTQLYLDSGWEECK